MSASAGLSAAKRRRGGTASRGPPPSVPETIQEASNDPIDPKSLLLKHDYTIFQMEQAIGHLLNIVSENSSDKTVVDNLTRELSLYKEKTNREIKELQNIKMEARLSKIEGQTEGEN
jgi:hypothetical protein